MKITTNAIYSIAIAGLAAVAVSGCGLTPGSYTGLTTPAPVSGGNSEPTEITTDNGAVFKLMTLTPQVMQQLAQTPSDLRLPMQRPPVDRVAEYRVKPQDYLRIIVWDHPELNNPGFQQTLGVPTLPATSTAAAQAGVGSNLDALGRVVQLDGTIFYPYAGLIVVAGKTVEEIRKELTTRLGKNYIQNPQISVSVSGFRSQKIYVSGEVKAPGAVPLTDSPERLTDAISAAGGYTPDADLSGATVSRGTAQFDVNLYRLFFAGDISQNMLLQDGDVVNLPDRRYKKVFVLGEVIKPYSAVMPLGRYTLTEALSDAGGLDPAKSNASQIYVIRNVANKQNAVYHLDARSPLALIMADDFVMQPRDVVYVDPAAITRFNRVIQQILPISGSAQLLR